MHRGHRLAFAAAGAVSLAAFAIGGAMTSVGTTAAGPAAGGSTVAAGGVSPASVARATSNRPGEQEETRRSSLGSAAGSDTDTDTDAWLPVALVASSQTYADEADGPMAATGPTGLAEQLFPALGPILTAGSDSGSTTSVPAPMLTTLAPVGGLGIVGASDGP
jgi:hypothetical protein